MSLHRRSLWFVLLVLALLAGSIVAIATKPTVLGLDLKGGAQAIYKASPTSSATVDKDSMRRAIQVIRKRVDAFGVSEPEIQQVGTDQIQVSLPDVEDPTVVEDLVRPAQLTFYAFQPNLVGYVAIQGPDPRNPLTGTADLYNLIKYGNETDAREGSDPASSVYLFRKDEAHTWIAGPATTEADLIAGLSTNADTKDTIAAEYAKTPKKFETVTLKPGFVILTDARTTSGTAPTCGSPGGSCVLFHNVPGLIGPDIKSANVGFQPGTNNPTVEMQFTGTGRKKFAEVTKGLAQGAAQEGRTGTDSSRFWTFAIVLDGEIISSPFIDYTDNPVGINSDNAEISGGFATEKEARTLADQLSSGAIPINLERISTSIVGATLGEQSLRQGLIAGLIGLIVVMLFLIFYYRVLGLIASGALIIYGLYFWAVAKLVPIALTLPGIAGLILTIGVAADASVVIFERVREESRAGRPPRTAILNGYKRGLTAIIDANIVTLVTAAIIFLFATAGPRGFAFTLILGVLLSLFTAIIATQGALGLLVETKFFKNEKLMGLHAREIKWKLDIVGKWKFWLAVSFIPMFLGIIVIGFNGLKPGLDFKSGTEISLVFEKAGVDENGIRDVVGGAGYTDAIIQKFTTQDAANKDVTGFKIRTETLTGGKDSELITKLTDTFGAAPEPQINSVSETFGRDIVRNAVYAVIFAFIAMILYLTLRFEYKLALPALLSVVHDVWLSLAIYSIAGKEVTGATVAALLTILGYSLYDVVIVFDRIRENVPLMKGRPYRDIVNKSVHETLTRSIITMILTLLPIVVLLIFGGETLRDFSFALMVGILAGGVSSIFISAPIAALWKEREPDEVKAAARLAKKVAREASVDSDIMDVSAFNRADAALAAVTDTGAGEAPPLIDDAVLELPDDTGPVDDGPESGRSDGPEDADGGSPASKPKPPNSSPPQRPRRHQSAKSRRRK
jgi:SecD/SecF fusion protein